MPYLKYKRLKLKLRVFSAGHSVAMVTYNVMKIIPTCSRMALTLISNTFELCARYFYAYARPFNVVTNILRILTVIFHTEEGLYTRNVSVNTQF